MVVWWLVGWLVWFGDCSEDVVVDDELTVMMILFWREEGGLLYISGVLDSGAFFLYLEIRYTNSVRLPPLSLPSC